MYSRAVVNFSPSCGQVRTMATLKDISMRLKAVTNIQKITKSMKIVSAAKFNKAEKDMRVARPYGKGAKVFYERAEVSQDEKAPNHLIISMSSDRGLCGAIHSSIGRAIRDNLPNKNPGTNVKFIPVGDKTKSILQRLHKDNILMHFADIGKKPPSFSDAAIITNGILNVDYEFDHGELYYNVFKSVVSYRTTILPVFNQAQVNNAEKIHLYDSIDEDVLRNYNEFSLASLIFYCLKEGACSEQSARMTAMEAATKNAGEMIDALTLAFNRKRQHVITSELIEIISGAAALE